MGHRLDSPILPGPAHRGARWWCVWLGWIWLCGAGWSHLAEAGPASPISAIAPQAVQHLAAAKQLYRDGKYEAAAEELDRVQQLLPQPSPPILYNLARCMHKAGRLEEAIQLYGSYLQLQPGARDRKQVQQLLEELNRQLGPEFMVAIRLTTTPPGATLHINGTRHRTCLATPCQLRLKPGTWTFRLSRPGLLPVEERLQVALGEPLELAWPLSAEPLQAATSAPGDPAVPTAPAPPPGSASTTVAPAVAGGEAPAAGLPEHRPAAEPGFSSPPATASRSARPTAPPGAHLRTVGWIALGTGGLSAAAATGLGMLAWKQQGRQLSTREVDILRHRVQATNVLLGLAGASLATGLTLLLLEQTGSRPSDAELASSAGALSVRWSPWLGAEQTAGCTLWIGF